MASGLPYFKWYPADAMADEFYASLSYEEKGFYHQCLNLSWSNNGLPVEMDDLAKLTRVSRKFLDKIWKKIGQRFESNGCVRPRLVNPRLEEEREKALDKSLKNKRYGNSNASKENRDKNANANETRSDREENAFQRARVSAYDSPSSSVPKVVSFPSSKFEDFWKLYPIKQNRPVCEGVWSTVSMKQDETAIFACLQRYLASARCAESPMNPATWLHDCARDKWESDWPRAPEKKGKDAPEPKKIDHFAELRKLEEKIKSPVPLTNY